MLEAILAAFTSTVYYTAEVTTQPIVVQAQEVEVIESIEDKIARTEKEFNLREGDLYNLLWCESRLDPNADNGYDRGIAQINRKHWPDITDEQAFNPEWAMRWAAEKLASGEGYIYTCGNCYSFVVTQLGKIPRMADIVPNTPYPRVGDIIIFYYGGVKHIAVISAVTPNGIEIRECNYDRYLCGSRIVSFDDPALIGFHTLEFD